MTQTLGRHTDDGDLGTNAADAGTRKPDDDGPERLAFQIEEIADGVIMRPIGPIDNSRVTAFRLQLADIQFNRPARLVVDLSDVDELCSAAIATLVEALGVACRDSTLFVLCGLRGRVKAMLEIVRLDATVFTVVATVDEAVALPNRRKFGRYAFPSVLCDRGEVLDISAGGVRLRSSRRLRGRKRIRLWNEECDIVLQAKVIRALKIDRRHYATGLQFVDLGEQAAKGLAALLARACRTLPRFPLPTA